MAIMYCELCERPVEARRRIGGWTWFWAFLSVGVSTLAIPFYRKRCPICQTKAVSKIVPGDHRLRREELQERLHSTTEELDSTSSELDRARAERDFYRELSDPDRRSAE